MPTNYSTHSKKGQLTRKREPYQFMLWLGLIGSSMLFLSLIIVYLQRKIELGWYGIHLPRIFWLSTLVIFSSSITLFEAQLAFRTERFKHYRICLSITFLLGLLFTITQAVGWLELVSYSLPASEKSSLFFISLVTGLHFLHILGGMAFLGILLTEALRNDSYIDAFVYSVNAPNVLRLKLLGIYWHFIGFLWLLLFFILLIYQVKT